MVLKAEEIHKVAHLARLNIDDAAMPAYQQSLTAILDLVNQMQAVDTQQVQPMAHPMDATQRLRIDEVIEHPDRDKLQRLAPATEQGLYLVPRVVE